MSKLTEKLAAFCEKHPTLYKCILFAENAFKKPVFKCEDCGQCVLSYNGFVCCMRCPKQIRNGPCGGTRPDGKCEVYPDRPCIWWLINERSKCLRRHDKLRKHHIPLDRRFEHTSAWINMFAGKILPMGIDGGFDEEKEAELDKTIAEKNKQADQS